MTKLKYAVYPGYVTSENDEQEHYITSSQLISLYQVDPRECMVISNSLNLREWEILNKKVNELNLIELHPKFNGDYNVK